MGRKIVVSCHIAEIVSATAAISQSATRIRLRFEADE